jgi:hypothetical protein
MNPPVFIARSRALALLASIALLTTSVALAQEASKEPVLKPADEKPAPEPASDVLPPDAPQVPGFVCLGESEALLRGTSLKELKQERDKYLNWINQKLVPPERMAHTHCVVAELMRRIGDMRADEHYKEAIRLNPKEPAYQLWYTRYWQWSRGAGAANAANTHEHALTALDELEGFQGITQTGSTNEVATEWSQRQLLTLTQEDGLPLLPWNAYPFKKRKHNYPQVSLIAYGDSARDTNDFWDFADTRKLTTEAQIAADRDADHVLTKDQLLTILRAPYRVDSQARLRLRQSWLGTFDLYYRRSKLYNAQIVSYDDIDWKTDVNLQEMGVAYRRTINLYPLFDFTIDANYGRQQRTGVVETLPWVTEDINVYTVSPTLSHFVGPDKLSVGGTYVYFDIPDRPEPALDQSQRQRTIKAGFVDYAIYRPIRFPQVQAGTLTARRQYTRGWHWFATGMWDDERFGSTMVRRRAYGGGTTLKGIQGYDIGLYGTYMSGASELDRELLKQLQNSQARGTFRIMKRLVDEDITPGIPKKVLTSLNMNVVVRNDRALIGPKDFESVRATVDLWAKFLALNVRGTSFLVNASVSYQYFYHLDKGYVLGQLSARMGWPSFGTLLAY